jgi:AraC family transcriptional regulator
MGICHDNPYVSPLDKLRYDACVAVPPGVKGTGEVGAYDLQGGKYAVYRLKSKHKDKMTEAVEVIFDQLILGWLPGSGYQPDDRPYIDIYNGFGERSNGSVFDVDVCLPVKPL